MAGIYELFDNLNKNRMPTKKKLFRNVKFPPEIIKDAYKAFLSCLNEENQNSYARNFYVAINEDESWSLDNENEFYSEYRKEIYSAEFRHQHKANDNGTAIFSFSFYKPLNEVELRIGLSDRHMIEKVFEILESSYQIYRIPDEEIKAEIESEVEIFIGHGKNNQWKELKDHLQDKHKFNVSSYETGARAGYTITEILEEMSSKASFALLVLTGEDDGVDGITRARENVIHETGLFQGKLSFKKAIVVLEEGCNEFTNISGVQQIRFSKGSIKETYGDILATIYREFG